MAFPTTPVLDDFNRANQGPPPSSSWTSYAPAAAASSLRVFANVCANLSNNNGGVWGQPMGPDCEAHATMDAVTDGSNCTLYVRLREGGGTTADGYLFRSAAVNSNPGYAMRFFRLTNAVETQLGSTINDTNGTHVSGNQFGVSVIGTTLRGYLSRGTWTEIGSRTDSTYWDMGFLGLRMSGLSTTSDDFGGGTLGVPAVYSIPIIGHGAC